MTEVRRSRSTVTALAVVLLLVGPALAHPSQPVVFGPLQQIGHLAHGEADGLWVDGDRVYVSSRADDFLVVNVSDPTDPTTLGSLDLFSRDADSYETDNRTIVVLAADDEGIHLVDATDGTDPFLASTIELDAISHNAAVHRPAEIVYNSRSGVDGIDIVDVSDPDDPTVVDVWTHDGTSCHDITVTPEHDRMYCADRDRTLILDISDPTDPDVLGTITNDDVSLDHWAMPDADGDVLILGDEAFSGDPCDEPGPHERGPGMLWFYDISDPTDPELRSWVAPYAPDADLCTPHFGDLVGQDRVVVGWYDAGVALVDFADPSDPEIVGRWMIDGESNVWDARHDDGHVFVGDIDRGLDVLRIDDRPRAAIENVSDAVVQPGQTVRLEGHGLVGPGSGPPTVEVGDETVEPSSWAENGSSLTFEVPLVNSGPHTLSVARTDDVHVRYPGAFRVEVADLRLRIVEEPGPATDAVLPPEGGGGPEWVVAVDNVGPVAYEAAPGDPLRVEAEARSTLGLDAWSDSFTITRDLAPGETVRIPLEIHPLCDCDEPPTAPPAGPWNGTAEVVADPAQDPRSGNDDVTLEHTFPL